MSAAPVKVPPQTVLVLGAYGLIGAEVCAALFRAGHLVRAAGRDLDAAAKRLPDLPFVALDMAQLTDSGDWAAPLDGVDVVVNCAGALQDGARDSLEPLHHHALAALAQAAKTRDTLVIQISAIGADLDSPLVFLASKARGDAALLASGARAVVFRPGLVLAQGAYGGTALVRLLAAVPYLQPLALPNAQMQCVSATDVADALAKAVAGNVPTGQIFDLVETSPQSLRDIIAGHRAALGFTPARREWVAPDWMLGVTGWAADMLGHLGWRSPLRSTATKVLRYDLTGDPTPWSTHDRPLPEMPTILKNLNLGPEHRLQARMALLMPICVAVLALFWTFSGLMGLISLDRAAAQLTAQGWGDGMARASVVFWSLIDMALAVALLWRPWAQRACLGMIAVCLIYLGLGTLVTPAMWLDPLGPLPKIAPALVLSLVTWALLEER
ncbi:SDR family oxidoreductase [uncultured Pelagimonas sp.]|uniref:SDR family oxidoreductase n=1 Tax=uncultured Pelagimonas sp. TaxID=1618102 RepID=UPI00261BD6FB|nr:SDR family oxidoreductase [uncultured Pelagimonas sp.]